MIFFLHMKSFVLVFETLVSFYEILGSNFKKVKIGLTRKLLVFFYGHPLMFIIFNYPHMMITSRMGVIILSQNIFSLSFESCLCLIFIFYCKTKVCTFVKDGPLNLLQSFYKVCLLFFY